LTRPRVSRFTIARGTNAPRGGSAGSLGAWGSSGRDEGEEGVDRGFQWPAVALGLC
jgi:hypothetical protein